MEPWPYLANDPQLHNHTLYSTYRGANLADLVRRFPDRRIGRIVRQYPPGTPLNKVSLLMEPLRFARQTITATVDAPNPNHTRYVALYVTAGDQTAWDIVDTSHAATGAVRSPMRITPDGIRFGNVRSTISHLPKHGLLTVGVVVGNELPHRDISRAEHRYDFRVVGTGSSRRVEVLLADEQWVRFSAVDNWLPLDISNSVSVAWPTAAN